MRVKYVRWSSIGQNADRQLLNEKFFDKVYQEQVSGVVSFENRKEGGRLLADIKVGKVKELYVEEISRIGRDSLDCMKTLKVCEENKVNVVIENMSISSLVENKPNPVFKIITGILSTMAENEKQNIRERTEMGRIAARMKGVKFGRVEGYRETMSKFLSKPKTKSVMKLLESGKGYSIDEMVRLSETSIAFVMKCKKVMNNQYKEDKPIKELLEVKPISSKDNWKLKALETQLEWIKNNVIPIPNKK